jgi:hypothetical protein
VAIASTVSSVGAVSPLIARCTEDKLIPAAFAKDFGRLADSGNLATNSRLTFSANARRMIPFTLVFFPVMGKT